MTGGLEHDLNGLESKSSRGYTSAVTDRSTALAVLAALRHTPVGDSAVLIGSSGLFGFETQVPALTEDVDVAVDTELVQRSGDAIVEALADQGFSHEAEDVRASAQDATLALAGDPTFNDAGAEGYVTVREEVERGLRRLNTLLEALDA